MIKVLFFEATLPVGGAEMMLFQQVTNLDKSRFQAIVVCCYGAGTVGERFRALGIPVYEKLFRSAFDPRGLWALLKICRRERFDLLHTNGYPVTMLWGRLIGSITGIRKYVVAIHSTAGRGRVKRGLVNYLARFDAIIALSPTHRQTLARIRGLPNGRMHVVHNGIDASPYLQASSSTKRPAGVPTGVPLVGIVAMLRSEKAHDVFLQAAAGIQGSTPAHFLLIGDGPERSKIERMVEELRLGHRVHILGCRDDVAEILQTLDVVVLSSSVETFPVSILEAMASGKPVVCTKVGSIQDLVIDGQTGVLVPPNDPLRLGQDILSLLQHPNRAKQMGRAGREHMLANFTLDRMIRDLEGVLNGVLGSQNLPDRHRGPGKAVITGTGPTEGAAG